MFKTCCLLLSFFISLSGFSQNVSDAFRYLQPINGGGVNGLASGYSNTTFGTDASALFSNPASLGFIKKNQISVGFGVNNFSTESNLNDGIKTNDYSNTGFDHTAFIIPVSVAQGSFVLGWGYSRIASFDQLSTGSGYNANSSYAEGISGYDPSARPAIGSSDLNDRLNNSLYFEYAFEAFLIDTVRLLNGNFRYRTPVFKGNVNQEYSNVNEGSLNMWTGGFALEAVKDVFVGATLDIIFGASDNIYKWNETAAGSFYTNNPDSGIVIGNDKYTFNRLEMTETIEDEIAGYTIKIGTLAKLNQQWRAGLSITLPTTVTISSKYSYDLVGYFRNTQSGVIYSFGHPNGKYSDKISYDITGPSIIEINLGYVGFPFQAEVGLTTMNWSNTKFSSNDDLLDFSSTNESVKFNSKRIFRYKAGAQYALTDLTSIIRAGIAANEVLDQSFRSSMDMNYSFGWEFVPSTEYRINFGYAYSNKSVTYTAYTPAVSTNKSPVKYTEKVGNHFIVVGTSFNF